MSSRRSVAALALLLFASAACADAPSRGGDEDSTPGSVPVRVPFSGGALTLGIEGEVASIAPGEVASPPEMTLAHAIYDGLATYRQGRIAPQLAEQIDSNDEFTRFTLLLREGITFHDGTRLDANAVVRHFDRLRAASTACPCAVELAQISSMETPDGPAGRAVVFNLGSPNVSFPHLLAGRSGFIESPAAVDEGLDLRLDGIGTGPFVLNEAIPGVSYRLEKNPEYWARDDLGIRLPYLDQLTVVLQTDGTERLVDLGNGVIDLLHTTDPETIGRADRLGLAMDKPATSNTTLLLLNNDAPPFDDVRARRAVAFAVDRTQVNEPGNEGVRLPTSSLFSADSAYYNPGAAPPGYDAQRSQALVTDLGGLRFTILCVSDPEASGLMPTIKRLAEAVGMEVTLQVVDPAEFSRRVRDLSGDYQAACFRGAPAFDPDAVRPGLVAGSGANLVFYRNSAVDGLLERGRRTASFEERRQSYFDLQELLAADVPLIPIVHLPLAYIYDTKQVGGPVTWQPSGTVAPALLHVREG